MQAEQVALFRAAKVKTIIESCNSKLQFISISDLRADS